MTDTLKFAVIGHPVAHSRSPEIHAAFADQFNINLIYERIDATADAFEATVQAFFADGGRGLNVTVPFKERAWQIAAGRLSPRALDAQAVNTLWQQTGQTHGCNTDGVGLVRDLQRLGMPLRQANVLVIGAGGAARGVLGPLLDAGCQRLHIVNRTRERAQQLVAHWQANHQAAGQPLSAGGLDDIETKQRWHLVINATAASLQGQPLALPPTLFGANTHVYDMMYGSELTVFLRQAQQAGSTNLADGLGMLVEQAAESFRIWHGQLPNTAPVIAQIRAQLQSRVR